MKTSTAHEIGHLKAKDVMKTEVCFAINDMSLTELAELFESKDVTGVPVVDQKGKVIGVVSETDLVASQAVNGAREKEVPRYFRVGWEEGESGSEAIDYENMALPVEKRVEDIMTPWVISVTEDAPVSEIAKKMTFERVHRVLVMDSTAHLKGIISSMDLVRLLAGNPKKLNCC